jgi:uncharacterized membrane protein YfcA
MTELFEALALMNITNPILFYVLALSAALTTAASKAGFGGAVAIGIPILLLVTTPRIALGITLPILLLIDVWIVFFSKNKIDLLLLLVMSVFGLFGHAVGWYFFDYISNDALIFFISGMSILTAFLFFKRQLRPERLSSNKKETDEKHNLTRLWLRGGVWCTLSGVASFVSVSGGIPLQIFLLAFRLKRSVYLGSAGAFFFLLNLSKVPLYWDLDILSKETFLISITLLPAIPFGVLLGRLIGGLLTDQQFYIFMHVILGLVGFQLLYGVLA